MDLIVLFVLIASMENLRLAGKFLVFINSNMSMLFSESIASIPLIKFPCFV